MIDVAVILNPGSGSGSDEEERRRQIVELLAAHGREATIFALYMGSLQAGTR